jgi:hypothetical protein
MEGVIKRRGFFGTLFAAAAAAETLVDCPEPESQARLSWRLPDCHKGSTALQTQGLGGGPNKLLTPDQWGYYLAWVTGQAPPAPEDLGFARKSDGAGTPIKFAAYWAALVAFQNETAGFYAVPEPLGRHRRPRTQNA